MSLGLFESQRWSVWGLGGRVLNEPKRAVAWEQRGRTGEEVSAEGRDMTSAAGLLARGARTQDGKTGGVFLGPGELVSREVKAAKGEECRLGLERPAAPPSPLPCLCARLEGLCM